MRKMKSPFGFQTIGANRKGAIITAPVVAPTISGSLADVNTTQLAAGTVTVNAAGVFVGSGITYTLTTAPAGVTINASTGVVTIARDAVLTAASVVVRGTNAGGFASAGFSVTVAASAPIATTELSSVNYDGETFTFAVPAPVGTYHGGEPFALTSAPISVTAMGTPSAGAGNGAMANPRIDSPNNQGFDPLLATNTQINVAYGRDVDPTAAGAPYAVPANSEVTVVKSRRAAGAVAASWRTIEKYLPFTFLPASKAPQVGDFRPGMCSTDKVSRLNINSLDLGCCRSLDLSGMGYPSVATVLARWKTAQPWFCKGADQMRVLNVLTDFTSSNYMTDIAVGLIGDTGALLHSNIPASDKIALATVMAPVAIDVAAQFDVGHPGGAGAGQHEFYGPLMAWVAALFDSTYMYDTFQNMKNNIDQVYWADASNVGENTNWPDGNEGGDFQYVQCFVTEDIGKPVWGGSDGGFPWSRSHGSQLNRTYSNSGGSGRARLDTWFPVALILANRSMPNGLDIMKGGAGVPNNNDYSPKSHRSAMIHKLDIDYTQYPLSNINHSTRARNLYAAHRSLVPAPVLLTVPDTIYYSNFTAGANVINWNYAPEIAANAFSRSPITALNLWISQDNVQFVEVPAVANSGSRAAPGGIKHYCAAALQNAQGKGRRSYTTKNITTDVDVRGAVTPSGTPTGAVTCDTLPKLLVREFPKNLNVNWFVEPVGAVTPGMQLLVGSGIWSGAISGAATTIVQRETTLNAEDWVNVPGSNAQIYTMVVADLGKRLRVGATRNGVTVYGPPISIGTLAALPAGTIIDTDFGSDFTLYNSAFWASLQAESSTTGVPVHEPYRDWGLGGLTSIGGIRGIKTGTYPRNTGELTGLEIGKTYRVICHVPVEADTVARSATGIFRLGTTKLGLEYYSAVVPYDTAAGALPTLFVVDTTFTATSTTLWIMNNINTNVGGTVGGNPALSKLSVNEV